MKNVAYKGTLQYGKTFKAKYHRVSQDQPMEFGFLQEGQLNQGDVPEEEWYVEDKRNEALIPPEEFDEVLAAMATRSHRVTRSLRCEKRTYLLSGIAKCKRCGSPLQGHTQRGKNGQVYYRYACSTAKKYGPSQCARYSLVATDLEAHVLKEVRKYLDTDCALESLRQGLEQLLDEKTKGKAHLDAVRHKVAAMAAKRAALFKMLAPDNIEMLQPDIDEMTAEEKRLKKAVAEAEREAGAQMDREAFITRALDHYREHVLTLRGGCENALRESLLALGISVTYDPDKKEGGIEVAPFVCSATV